MSMQHVAYVLNELTHLSASDTLVLVALADAADPEHGQCWPSVGYIAKVARCSRRTVQYALNRLEENGWIHSKMRSGSSLYTLLFDRSGNQVSYEDSIKRRKAARDRDAAEAAEGGRSSCTPRTARDATDAPRGATVARGGATDAHMNQSLTQSKNQDARAREAPAGAPAPRSRAKNEDPNVDPVTGVWLGERSDQTERIESMRRRVGRRETEAA